MERGRPGAGCGGRDAVNSLSRSEGEAGGFFDKGCLLLGREHQVAIPLLHRGQRGEYSAPDAEVDGPHVGTLFCTFQKQCQPSKILSIHWNSANKGEIEGHGDPERASTSPKITASVDTRPGLHVPERSSRTSWK